MKETKRDKYKRKPEVKSEDDKSSDIQRKLIVEFMCGRYTPFKLCYSPKSKARALAPYFGVMLRGHEPVTVRYEGLEGMVRTERTPEIVELLEEKDIPYLEENLRELLQEEGRETGWIDDFIQQMGGKVKDAEVKETAHNLAPYLFAMLCGHQPVTLSYTDPHGKSILTAKTPELVEGLNKEKIAYKENALKEQLQADGISTDWVDAFMDQMCKEKPDTE